MKKINNEIQILGNEKDKVLKFVATYQLSKDGFEESILHECSKLDNKGKAQLWQYATFLVAEKTSRKPAQKVSSDDNGTEQSNG